jgi:ubiquinone/menaquinone biosynthesis C-methylase UbiE
VAGRRQVPNVCAGPFGAFYDFYIERPWARSLQQVELLEADMTALPFADGEVDLFLSYSGLHMVPDPERAVAEMARCLKPGGELIGTSFFSDVTRCPRAARTCSPGSRRPASSSR